MAESKKTLQIRIPIDLGADVSLLAPAFGQSVPEYIEEKLRQAVAEDWPRYLEIVQDRARAAKGRKGKPPA